VVAGCRAQKKKPSGKTAAKGMKRKEAVGQVGLVLQCRIEI